MKLRKDRGVTLIELLIALVVSAIIVAALYRTFVSQQKSYVVQEQVADMQQNARVALNRMMREIRMAGFGGVDQVLGLVNGVNGFTQALAPGANTITIVGGFKQIRRDNGDPITVDSASGNTVTLDYTPDAGEFNTKAKRFISIGGLESYKFDISGKVLTLDSNLKVNHPKGTPIFKIQALTYNLGLSDGKMVLRRNENTGGGAFAVAENIESLQFEYFDASENPTVIPGDVRMVRVTLTARTDLPDPGLTKAGSDGFRRRTISSNIQIRNMGVTP
jgi:prepilin-type N-terminal cleavage/methylation domain-containing protein